LAIVTCLVSPPKTEGGKWSILACTKTYSRDLRSKLLVILEYKDSET